MDFKKPPGRSTAARVMRGPLHVDVTYTRGPMGKSEKKTVRHVVPGYPRNVKHYPDPAGVAHATKNHPRHRAEIKAGWRTERAEGGYGKKDEGKRAKLKVIARARKKGR